VVLALLSLYRVIKYPGVLKLSSITDDFKGLDTRLPQVEVALCYNRLFKKLVGTPEKGARLLPIRTAGPNSKISFLGAPLDAYHIAVKCPNLVGYFATIAKFFDSEIFWVLEREIRFIKDLISSGWKAPPKETRIGKLSLKEEAAGKIRVFAIADVWTQSILRPIHDHIFSILRKIPEDGTFDQSAPLFRLMRRLRKKTDKTVYSYDLSSATDRVPIDLQVQLLSLIYNSDLAAAWKGILVDRNWELEGREYRYSVGQPMGAYSSWGVFALTHHLILQLAAWRVGHKEWFSDYALLGDDIVIADTAVAKCYYTIMTEHLGVDINLSKSLVSAQGVMEFAKRLVSPDEEYSPLGAKNIVLALKDRYTLPSIFIDAMGKGEKVGEDQVSELVDQLKPSVLRFNSKEKVALYWSMLKPFGFIPNWTALAPFAVEESIRQLSIELVAEKIEEALLERWEHDFHAALEKSMAVLNHLTAANVWFGDTVIPLRSFPSYSSFFGTSCESVIDLWEDYPSLDQRQTVKEARYALYRRPRWGLDSVTELVWAKSSLDQMMDLIPTIIPEENWLMPSALHRKQLRSLNVEFFKNIVLRAKSAKH
jgi:hypothetical protein